jgi:hypothetical protein
MQYRVYDMIRNNTIRYKTDKSEEEEEKEEENAHILS